MPKKEHPKSPRLRGTVVAYNASPRGGIEGALVETPKGTVQLNFPKHGAEEVARSMAIGSRVDVEAEPETEDFDHPVYRLGEARADRRGRVVRLNYALHGEVNGVHLRDGTFVHLKPEGAQKIRARVGDWIEASGVLRRGDACVVLEASTFRRIEPPRRAPPRLESPQRRRSLGASGHE